VDRREAIRHVTALLGGTALVGGNALWSAACRAPQPSGHTVGSFTPSDVALLDEIAETILPETGTPGAKAAGVGPFMAQMVTDCYADRDQRIFREGMGQLDQACVAQHGTPFLSASPASRLALLTSLDREQKAYMDTKAPDAPSHYFRMMKELTLLGYFTSEIGCTRAQRYTETPGRYDPCVPYVPGTPSWARHG
jgi:hypothetical protein